MPTIPKADLSGPLALLAQALAEAGYSQRVDVVRAAVAAGGSLTRDEAVAAAGMPPGSALRGFTRPFNRITAELRASGQIPADMPDPVHADYDESVAGYQRALGFTIPDEWLTTTHDSEED